MCRTHDQQVTDSSLVLLSLSCNWELIAYMCPYHRMMPSGTGQRAVTLCGWETNRSPTRFITNITHAQDNYLYRTTSIISGLNARIEYWTLLLPFPLDHDYVGLYPISLTINTWIARIKDNKIKSDAVVSFSSSISKSMQCSFSLASFFTR